ncbi:hypothetical protein BKA62DRAFT_434457 [Auriculariales sp. MPI-PUGE-AT-0066]|nr:hypothetical protein BKA62DRAFT_434457 [Auriculariales sp. MPI-PUGE-AT-0066]
MRIALCANRLGHILIRNAWACTCATAEALKAWPALPAFLCIVSWRRTVGSTVTAPNEQPWSGKLPSALSETHRLCHTASRAGSTYHASALPLTARHLRWPCSFRAKGGWV